MTDALGSSELEHILKFVKPSKLIVSLYNPSQAPSSISALCVEVRRGDYDDTASLDSVFSGADILFLVSFPSLEREMRVKKHTKAIAAAKRARVKHIFYTSLAFTGPPTSSESVAAVMLAHMDTEDYTKKCGLPYTTIREGIVSELYPLYLGLFGPLSGVREVTIPADGNGRIAWVSRHEPGEGTARLIAQAATGDAFYFNKTLLLSGPKAISLSQLA